MSAAVWPRKDMCSFEIAVGKRKGLLKWVYDASRSVYNIFNANSAICLADVLVTVQQIDKQSRAIKIFELLQFGFRKV